MRSLLSLSIFLVLSLFATTTAHAQVYPRLEQLVKDTPNYGSANDLNPYYATQKISCQDLSGDIQDVTLSLQQYGWSGSIQVSVAGILSNAIDPWMDSGSHYAIGPQKDYTFTFNTPINFLDICPTPDSVVPLKLVIPTGVQFKYFGSSSSNAYRDASFDTNGDPSVKDMYFIINGTAQINHSPTIQPISDQAGVEGKNFTFYGPLANDIDQNAAVSVSANVPDGATFYGHTFSWTPRFDQAGVYPVTFTATDDGNQGLFPSLQASETINVTVQNAPPNFHRLEQLVKDTPNYGLANTLNPYYATQNISCQDLSGDIQDVTLSLQQYGWSGNERVSIAGIRSNPIEVTTGSHYDIGPQKDYTFTFPELIDVSTICPTPDTKIPLSLVVDSGVQLRYFGSSSSNAYRDESYDTNGDPSVKDFYFIINNGAPLNNPPTITTTALPGATMNVAYSQALGATGSSTPFSWSIASGALPAGLSLDASTGVISGTPTTVGTSTFTVEVTDANSQTATQELSIYVASPPTQLPFSDDFNRPDSTTVGNGWIDDTAQNTNLSILNGRLYNQTGDYAGIHRVILLDQPITVSADTAPTNGFGGLRYRYGTDFLIKGNGSLQDGYGFEISRADEHFPSQVNLMDHGAYIATLPSTFQFTDQVHVVATFNLDNSITGVVFNAQGDTFNFSFPARTIADSSSNFDIMLTQPTNGAYPWLDNLVLTKTPVITTTSLPEASNGVAYSQTVLAFGGVAPLTRTISNGTLPAGFSFDSSTGHISGTPTVNGTSNFTVQVTDANSNTASQALTIVVANPLSITTNTLPAGKVAVAYNKSLAASGGTAPYLWSVSNGALPDGLPLSTSGIISGTPTTPGTYNFDLGVTDSLGQTVIKSFHVVINSFHISTGSLPSGKIGNAYSKKLAATGGTTPYTWAQTGGALPSGLSFDPSTATISGTPTVSGTFSVTITATDANSQADTNTYTLKITSPAITTNSVPNGVQGATYSKNLVATGGVTPYTWTIASGTLPTGLTLNTTGSITGTPSVSGSFAFTVQVSDANAQTDTADYTLTVNKTTITTNALSNGKVGNAYSKTMTASQGTSPYAWTVTGGTLPDGLTLSTSGAISGTPTTASTTSVTITATDANGVVDTQTFSLKINP